VDYEKAYRELLAGDTLSIRERIVLEVLKHRPKYTAGMTTAAALTLINFIENTMKTLLPKSIGREPSLPMDFEVFLPKNKKRNRKIGKRKYTKKSKFWAKKKSA